MAGRTGYTGVAANGPMRGPEQITDVYEWFDPLIDGVIDKAADLPDASSTFPGREIRDLSTGLKRWNDGSAWQYERLPRLMGTFTPASGMTSQSDVNVSSIGDLVVAHLHVVCSSTINTGFQIGTVGAGFRPFAQEVEVGHLVDGGNPGLIQVLINPNGTVSTFGFLSQNSPASKELRVTLKYIRA
ncbi:hypothetical protein NY588_09530 [Curtobacterium flaccumfaciens pv. beticola]|uniref:hypothetical protein n=1 Tax=Curtobacterium flaccumfaciens TaxID=2035 RepID=UPI00349F967A|nr:hypothetical protein [Curtobacterium flaccumfaciens pv. basellae]